MDKWNYAQNVEGVSVFLCLYVCISNHMFVLFVSPNEFSFKTKHTICVHLTSDFNGSEKEWNILNDTYINFNKSIIISHAYSAGTFSRRDRD